MNVEFENGLRITVNVLFKFYDILKPAIQNGLNTTSYLVVRRQLVKAIGGVQTFFLGFHGKRNILKFSPFLAQRFLRNDKILIFH